jgi:hypothetical protein
MGRWSKERHAQEAAKKAEDAAKNKPETEVTETPDEPQPEFGRVPTRNEPRWNAMNEVVERHNKTSGMEPEPKEEPKAEAPKAEALEVPKAEPEAPKVEPKAEAPVEPEPQVAVTKQVVDGKEYEVPQAEIDEAGGPAAWRKSKAADNRLAEAKETLAESKRTQQQFTQYLQSVAQQQPQQPTQQQVEHQQFLQNRLEYIRQGTPEQAAQALNEILARSVPQINPEAIKNQTIMEMRYASGADNFKKEFQDISVNQNLMQYAGFIENQKLAQLRQRGVFNDPRIAMSFDWNEFFRSIGNEVRSAVRPPQPAPVAQTPSQPSQGSEKEARKASIVNLPTAAARAELPKEEKPETREDVLNQMRKKRGLHTG